MTKRRTHHAKHPKKSKPLFGIVNVSAFMAALVALSAWAHQQGIISWELPPSLAAAPSEIAQGVGLDLPGLTPAASTPTAAVDPDGVGSVAGASPENCAPQFFDGKAPVLTNDKMAAKTQTLCYTGFAVLSSGVTRTPLWAAEHLTAERLAKAATLPREDSFHADPNLPKDERAELGDYKSSGFDRGHMAPNADMPDVKSQAECFTLANIVPQSPENNRGIWKEIEEEVRAIAEKNGDIYVVSGPIFSGADVEQLNDRVMVPTQFFKAVYDVKQRKAAAYVVQNKPGNAYQTMSLTELRSLTGIDVFPGVAPATVGTLALPAPIEKRPG